jgi:hypothetical protein
MHRYYVDHANHNTQWDDPRLTHADIWTPENLARLHSLQSVLPAVYERTLRSMLLQ